MNIIYTDGACCKNGLKTATGGFGLYLKKSCFGDELKINRKGEPMQFVINDIPETFYVTNIRMEGLAIAATMFLYVEKFAFEKEIMNPVQYLNENFLNHDRPLKERYEDSELTLKSSTSEPMNKNFEIVTDSQFWINVIEKWLPSWVRKGIITEKKNPDLLLLIHYYYTALVHNGVTMVLTHVRSHQRGKRTTHADGNDVADVLATSSANNPTNQFMKN